MQNDKSFIHYIINCAFKIMLTNDKANMAKANITVEQGSFQPTMTTTENGKFKGNVLFQWLVGPVYVNKVRCHLQKKELDNKRNCRITFFKEYTRSLN